MSDSVTRRTTPHGDLPQPPDAELLLPSDGDASPTDNRVAASEEVARPAEGSSARVRLSTVPDDQKTVISKRPPLSGAALAPSATPSEMGRILVGERLGHFQLEEFVGGGGMGAVFRATDMMLGRAVAVKVLSREQTDDETLLRFQREAQNAARLDHERIARVYYVNEDKGWHYIVFEYIDGVNVRDLVDEQGPLSIDEAVYYTLQVAEALRHAAKRDVVHRDIKPSNILVMADGRVKLVDMGLARWHQVEPADNDLTQSGVTLGTFDYISPEQAREPSNADSRSDIYSLGCTLYYMLTGRPPFPDGTVLQKLLSHSSDAPPDPRLYRPEIPDDICRSLMKMLAKNPAQRFQSPDELIIDLLRIADRLGLERTSSSGAVWVARPDAHSPWYERHLPWAAPVATLVLVVLALEWFTDPTRGRLSAPKPNLLPPVSAISAERRPGPTIPVAPRINRSEKPDASHGSTTTDNGADVVPPAKVDDPSSTDDETSDPAPPMVSPMTETLPGPKSDSAGKPVVTRLLIVGPASTPHTDDARVVQSLAQACALAADLPDLEAVELHFDGPRLEPSQRIDLRDIAIRAAPGRTPVLLFRPSAELPVDEHRMLRLAGGSVTFQGVQLRLELAAERAGDGWALFQLSDRTSLLLDGCALTIRNATSSGAIAQTGAAFMEVVPPSITDTEPLDPATLGRPLVRMFSTIARGEAPFVRSDAGFPFRLEWTQGLIATTDRLADIGGLTDESSDSPRVEIDLKNVTAAVRSGLCLMRSRSDAPKHLELKLSAADCIVLTDPSAALFEYRTLEMFDDLKRRPPVLEGHGNIFAGGRQYWRLVSQRTIEPVESPLNIALEEAAEYGFTAEDWSQTVIWKGLPAASRPVHTHVKADYLLSDDPSNPALRQGEAAAGFYASLPKDFLAETPSTSPPSAPPATPTREEPPMPMPTPSTTGMSDKMKMIMTPMSSPPAVKPMAKPVEPEPPSADEDAATDDAAID